MALQLRDYQDILLANAGSGDIFIVRCMLRFDESPRVLASPDENFLTALLDGKHMGCDDWSLRFIAIYHETQELRLNLSCHTNGMMLRWILDLFLIYDINPQLICFVSVG